MKKQIRFFLTFLLGLCICFSSLTLVFGTDCKIIDRADVLTDEEEAYLEEYIELITYSFDKDLVIYTDIISDGRSNMEIADDFYDNENLGVGDDKSGSLLFINYDSNQRGWWTCTTGSSLKFFDEDNINVIDDAIYPYMADGEYFKAFETYLECVYQLYDSGSLYIAPDYSENNSYSSYSSGNYYEPTILDDILEVLPVILAIFFFSTLMVFIKEARSMKTIAKASSADRYSVNGSFKLTRKENIFRGTTVIRTPIAQNNNNNHHNDHHTSFHSGGSGFSGGHFSSGGGFHGGGGRSF